MTKQRSLSVSTMRLSLWTCPKLQTRRTPTSDSERSPYPAAIHCILTNR